MSGEAGVNDEWSQKVECKKVECKKVECIHKSYNEGVILVGEHQEKVC